MDADRLPAYDDLLWGQHPVRWRAPVSYGTHILVCGWPVGDGSYVLAAGVLHDNGDRWTPRGCIHLAPYGGVTVYGLPRAVGSLGTPGMLAYRAMQTLQDVTGAQYAETTDAERYEDVIPWAPDEPRTDPECRGSGWPDDADASDDIEF